MPDRLQKLAAQAIVNVFETGSAHGDYGNVTVVSGDTGHLTYGRSQTTLASGNLYLLIKAYCDAAEAGYAAALRPYLDALQQRDLSLDDNGTFRNLLHEAGGDPVMRSEQDAFFDRAYWTPAQKAFDGMGAGTALGAAIVYDSFIHGSWRTVCTLTENSFGRLADIGEKTWFPHYVDTRRDWLANHQNVRLHPTVYRMDAFKLLIAAGNWDLTLPFNVRGGRIDEDVLNASPALRISAADPNLRVLMLQRPFMRGDDVRAVQQALAGTGESVDVDGIFGPGTERAVIDFQGRQGLTVDGTVGPATRAALGM